MKHSLDNRVSIICLDTKKINRMNRRGGELVTHKYITYARANMFVKNEYSAARWRLPEHI